MVEESAPLAESAQKAYYDSKNLPIPEDETPLGYFEAIYPNIISVTWDEMLEQKSRPYYKVRAQLTRLRPGARTCRHYLT